MRKQERQAAPFPHVPCAIVAASLPSATYCSNTGKRGRMEVSPVQLNTLIRVGSLAFNVAQDEKVQELFTIVHKGAKRRGIIGAMQPPAAPSGPRPQSTPVASSGGASHPIPFAPTSHPAPSPPPQVAPNLGKYLTADNAKKVMSWAGQISSLLMK
jgi:hypothetical protein